MDVLNNGSRVVHCTALVRDAEFRARLSVTPAFKVDFSPVPDAPTEVSLARPLPDLVILELGDSTSAPCASLIAQLRRAYPTICLAGICRVHSAVAAELVACVQAGLDTLVFWGYDDLRRTLEEAAERHRRQLALRFTMSALWTRSPANTHGILDLAITCAAENWTVSAIARELGISCKTVVRRLKAANLPDPHELIAWGRLICAVHLLADPGRTVCAVSEALGLAAPVTLRRLARRLTGRPLRALADAGPHAAAHALLTKLTNTVPGARDTDNGEVPSEDSAAD